MRPSFLPDGFVILSLQLETATTDLLLADFRARAYERVFQGVGSELSGQYRLSSRVTRLNPTLRIVSEAVQVDAPIRDSNYTPCVFSYMHSCAGGSD
ncbi:hypothetical protein P3T76_007759 [Phytophthora citrophthora]|uniref:Uncharacterized protein n=1 Tax=Phytophthora citrophthora TaxID=4793 RepID=A0AAD9GMS1_9STRA|nr:hypothetical protein P3T76_007759 [Phytophthora citrophthora]